MAIILTKRILLKFSLGRWHLSKRHGEGILDNHRNANMCPSSVLDRLNPLMENYDQLVLTRCGLIVHDDENGYSNGNDVSEKKRKNVGPLNFVKVSL